MHVETETCRTYVRKYECVETGSKSIKLTMTKKKKEITNLQALAPTFLIASATPSTAISSRPTLSIDAVEGAALAMRKVGARAAS